MSFSAPASSRDARPFHVLIVRTGAMGDVLHAMPAVAAMRLAHPEWKIGWAIEPRWRSLLESANPGDGGARPLVDWIHDVPTREWNHRPFSLTTFQEIVALRRELRAQQYDLCVDMQGLLRSAVVGWLAGAKSFVGQANPRETPARWFYGRALRIAAAHVIDRGCELLGGALGETLQAATVPLPFDIEAERWSDQLLARLLPHEGAPFAFLAPRAGWGAKRWPTERYGALGALLAGGGTTPLVNVAAEDDAVAAEVVAASGGVAQPVDCSIAELIALLQRVTVVIAGDTGPLHLAAALGRPVVALFGPTDPGRTGPYGTCCIVLRHPSSREDHRRSAEPESGLAQITVEEVAAAVRCVLSGRDLKGDV